MTGDSQTDSGGVVSSTAWLGGWQPLDTAPRDGTYILLAGPSGYIGTPLRVEVCKYDSEYRPRQPWVTFSNDSFMDGGEAPTCWMPLPPPGSASGLTVTIVEHPKGFLMRLEHDGASMTLDRAEAFDLHEKLSAKLGWGNRIFL